MKYLICGILGIAIGFFVFYLLFRIANKDKLYRKLQDGSKKKLPKPNFTKLVLVAVLFTYFVGLSVAGLSSHSTASISPLVQVAPLRSTR